MLRTLATVVIGTLLLVGCAEQGYVPVSGQVMWQGKPLEGASVAFQPRATGGSGVNAGEGSYGRTDAAGKFVLKRVGNDQPGAFVGTHAVIISKTSPLPNDDTGMATDLLPSRCRDGSLSFQVPATGTQAANFDLKPEP